MKLLVKRSVLLPQLVVNTEFSFQSQRLLQKNPVVGESKAESSNCEKIEQDGREAWPGSKQTCVIPW